ncbi:MAG: hypothetical protein ABW169_00850 [Sphingobium sp.]
MIRGRPLRFLVTILGGWTAMRMAMALPVPDLLDPTQPQFAKRTGSHPATLDWMFPAAPVAAVPTVPATRPLLTASIVPVYLHPKRPKRAEYRGAAIPGGGWSTEVADSMLDTQLAFAHAPRETIPLASFVPGAGLSPSEAGLPPARRPETDQSDRWSGAAWMLWRDDDGGPAYATGPRLGGSQAGVRVDYAVAPASPLRPALYARISSAVQGLAAAELAAGLALRPPLPLPVTIAIERREGLSPGGRSAFAVLASGGIPPIDIGRGFRLDGYGQAGMVGFRRRDAFADGRLTIERPIAGAPAVALGAGLWGGTQPGASRLDIGPQASVRLHLGSTTIRLGAEWREQVAGNAAPSSGPALSIGTDF